jgi:hypothetical protein
MNLVYVGWMAAIVTLSALSLYVFDIFKGSIKPERATWFIWTILGIITFLSQKADGAHASLWFIGAQTFGSCIIFVLSLKYGSGGLTKFDLTCLVAAGFGLILWKLTSNPFYALLINIGIDATGAIPTIRKAYLDPASETPLPWFMSGAGGWLGALAVGQLSFTLLLYPVYLATIDTTVALLLLRRPQS